jgi:hypothetical protein
LVSGESLGIIGDPTQPASPSRVRFFFCGAALAALAAVDRSMSLFRNKGGKTSQVREPSEAEGLALAVAAAMQWSRLRCAVNKMFFVDIAAECKRLKCTPSLWTHAEMVHFVQNKMFNSIPQEGLELYFTRKFTYETAARRAELIQQFIESVMYKYLAVVASGRDYDAAVELAKEAKLDKVLQSEALGGKPEWTLDDFLNVRALTDD